MNTKIKIILMDFIERIKSNKKRFGQLIAIVLILSIAIVFKLSGQNRNSVIVEASDTDVKQAEVYVDISGEVNNPGIYKADETTRVFEIIEKAGGLTSNANTDAINQAEYVVDGQKIIIPSINSGGESGDNTSSGLININTASKDKLMELNGVGEAIAGRIIDYRSSTRFNKIEDIKNVNGIGDATYEKIKDYITVY